MKSKTIEQLKKEESDLRKAYYNAVDLTRKAELKKALPKLKKQYQGKFFRFDNSPYDRNPIISLYSYCHKVTGIDEGIFTWFQLAPVPYKNEFVIKEEAGFYLAQTEISKEEFNKAKQEFLKVVNTLE